MIKICIYILVPFTIIARLSTMASVTLLFKFSEPEMWMLNNGLVNLSGSKMQFFSLICLFNILILLNILL